MKIMKKLLSKKEKWISGTIYIKNEDVEKVAEELVFITGMIGTACDEDSLRELCSAASFGINELTVCLPIITTEKIWKRLKASGKLNIVATQERRANKPERETKMVGGIILA